MIMRMLQKMMRCLLTLRMIRSRRRKMRMMRKIHDDLADDDVEEEARSQDRDPNENVFGYSTRTSLGGNLQEKKTRSEP